MPNNVDLQKSTHISGGLGNSKERTVFTIRDFQPKDQPAARRLILRGLGEYFGYINTSLNPDIDNIWSSYRQNGHLFVIAEIEGEVAGTGGLLLQPHATGQIVRMNVGTNFRRQGIGRALVQHLLQLGLAHRVERFVVETNRNWLNAIKLYQCCGFREYKQDDESVYLEYQQTTAGHMN